MDKFRVLFQAFSQLPRLTQVILVLSITLLLIVVGYNPAIGTSIIVFLLGLKGLLTQKS